MKASSEFIKQLEILFEQYEKEVLEKQREGILEEKTAKTYLLHSNNFVDGVEMISCLGQGKPRCNDEV
ncbi:hypothetical protein D3C81_1987930 [compost metagenome]